MERRAFMKFLCLGAGAAVVAAADPARALTSVAPLDGPKIPEPAPEAAVATEADLEQAQVEKTYWYYRRRAYWRPRRRRYWRRYYRPRVWRRRRYYYYY